MTAMDDDGVDGTRDDSGPDVDGTRDDSGPDVDGTRDDSGPDVDDLDAALRELRADLDAFEDEIEDRTVHRSAIEAELKRYVRRRLRAGHARGWGPYLVLLYGTAMTLGAFYFLSGGWAILAMVVIWLSTLGLYVLMVLAGAALGAVSVPRRAVDAIRDRRP